MSSFSDNTTPATVTPPIPPPRTELEYLRQQSARTRAGMRATVTGARRRIESNARVRSAIQKHPWLTVGAVAAVGCLVGRLVGRPRPAQRNGRDSSPSILGATLSSLFVSPLLGVVRNAINSVVAGFQAGLDEPPAEE